MAGPYAYTREERLQKFGDVYDRLNTPSEDERAQKSWDDLDRELFGPDWHGSMICASGCNTPQKVARKSVCTTPLLIRTTLAAAALAELASGKKNKKSHKKRKNTSTKKSKKETFASKVKKGKSAKDKAAAHNAA